MPTYEYECQGCGYEFESFQSMKDDPLKKCPECTKNKLKRKIGSGAGVIFKGSGFYCTDYRSDGYKKAAEKEKSSTSSSSSSASNSDKKSDSKPKTEQKTSGNNMKKAS